MDYRLDDLGWYQFERLCQALLRAQHGAHLEAWGGGSDFGRDAYSDGPLRYPDPQTETQGPFIFQVKFVSGANGPGADPLPALIKAVRAELVRIRKRAEEEEWEDPALYVLMTNAPLSAKGRTEVSKLIEDDLPDSRVILQSGRDIAAALDNSPQVRMSYPQILGIRDLNALLTKAVAADVVSRSTIALGLVAELAQVFVATESYNRALQILEHKGFAVLTGPPEMGKTATAWMVGLARLTCGWEVYDCRGPSELFRVFNPDSSQLFIADDAFGSTEYRPDVAAEWAAQLGKVIGVTDKKHWVLWTSRPGPLKIGLERLHLDGVIPDFPDPNQVVVDASKLSIAEKAQILYRHAKAADLPEPARDLLRRHATFIVQNPHFTPLRIQRLIGRQIGSVLQFAPEERHERLRSTVTEGLQEPTKSMRTSFNALPNEARLLLIAMLNGTQGPVPIEALATRMESIQGAPPSMSVPKLAELLEDHFIRLTESVSRGR